MSTLTGVDWYPAEPRFEVVYHLHSLERNERLRVKCRLPGGDAEIDSVTEVWRGANWFERETFDLFGVRFRNHPDLRRIMLPDDWEGHPLRKDYSVTGTGSSSERNVFDHGVTESAPEARQRERQAAHADPEHGPAASFHARRAAAAAGTGWRDHRQVPARISGICTRESRRNSRSRPISRQSR